MSKRERAVYFYKISPSPTFNIDPSNDTVALSQMFHKVFQKTDTTYPYVSSDNNVYYFDMIEITENYAYGKYSKKEPNPNDKMQMREKNENTESSHINKAKSLPKNTDLEYYTFFLVDFNKQIIAYINNKQSGKLNKVLWELFSFHEIHISIINYNVSDSKRIIEAFKSISQLELSYNDEAASEEFKLLLGNNGLTNKDEANLSSFNISIKFKEKNNNKTYLDRIIEKRGRFNKINIKGETENNIRQSFDFIQKSFMLHDTIEISGSLLENIENIKESLKKAIENIYNAKY